MHTTDVLVLGAGTAGLAAYRAARATGARALLVEAGRYGTTCARVGCMPSKLLIAAAEAAHAAAAAPGFGVFPGPVRVDGRAVMDRVRAERDRFVGFVLDGVEAIPAADRLHGPARFRGPTTVAVGDTVVQAGRVVIATGSRPRSLPVLAGAGDRLIVNDDVFDWTELPSSVAVFGPGVIGLELGQALHRLGVRVRLFGVGGFIGPLSDPEVRDSARAAFQAELPLHDDVRLDGVERVPAGVRVRWTDAAGSHEDTFDWALSAVGRVPNVDTLGLEATGLSCDARGVPLHDPATLQCGDAPIFIAGDAAADRPLLHEAADEGRIAGTNAGTHPRVAPGLRRSPLSIVFSDPQIAMVGERRAALSDAEIVVGAVDFGDQGRSRVMRQNRGRLHVYADRATGRLRGAELVGPRAEHLAHLLAWAHQQGMTIPQMLDMPFYHPVVEEGVRTALRDAAAKLSAVRG